MLKFEDACKKAYNFFRENTQQIAIYSAMDAGEFWLFFGDTDGYVDVGGQGIKLNKDSGEIEEFTLPNIENFQIMKNAVSLEVPNEFKKSVE